MGLFHGKPIGARVGWVGLGAHAQCVGLVWINGLMFLGWNGLKQNMLIFWIGVGPLLLLGIVVFMTNYFVSMR
jgi:hypothetical protein